MDIDKAENQVKKAGNFIDTLWSVFAKYWWKVLIMGTVFGIGYFLYWAITSEDVVEEPVSSMTDEAYITRTYKEIATNGDTLTIELWSDGVETIAE